MESDPAAQHRYFMMSISLRQLLPAAAKLGYWNHLFAYVDGNPIKNSDQRGLGIIDELLEKIGRKADEKVTGSILEQALGSGCIAIYCKRGVHGPVDYFAAFFECGSLLNKIEEKDGIQINIYLQEIGVSEDTLVHGCANFCSAALSKKNCCGS